MQNWIPRKAKTARAHRTVRWVVAWVTVTLLAADLAIVSAPRFADLLDHAQRRLKNWDDLEEQLLIPGAGLEFLGPDVVAAVHLLRSVRATTYRLSPAIRQDAVTQDAYLTQRVEETAWPIPYDPASHYLVRRNTEKSSCMELSSDRGMAVDYCD